MSYSKTLEYLYEQLPMYHRVGAAAYKPDLTNTIKLIEILGRPQLRFKSVHVAGTNGKGSSSHMLAAIMQKCGYRTGLYTSPHLVDFRERIRVNGKMIPKKYIEDFVSQYREQFEAVKPSFFEWTVALAFNYFAQEEVDVAIIETGLGGRLDSTNVITPCVSLITNISLDHTQLLGNTIEAIAREKAGIIKPRVPVVISQYQSETAPLFSQVAREMKSPVEFADKNFRITSCQLADGVMKISVLNRRTEESASYALDLTGTYQLKNVLGVLNALEFIEKNGFILEKERIAEGLSNVAKLTGLCGRWQTLAQKPAVIADTGHNVEGIKQVLENLRQVKYTHLHFVLGTVNDKDIASMLALLPHDATYYFVRSSVPRSLAAEELMAQASKFRLKGKAFASVEEGLKAAKKSASKTDLILIGGSTFVVGDAMLLYA